MILPPLTAEASLYKSSGYYRSSWPAGSSSGIVPSQAALRSWHGLDDSDSTGSRGYDVHSRGEVFIQGSWPRGAIWDQIWGVCDDHHCDGSFSIGTEWPVCPLPDPGLPTLPCHREANVVTVRVNGWYDRTGWDVRDEFMNDLLEHHFGDGGVYNNGDVGWGNGFGFPPGWWVASNTWIRHSGTGFWVNIQMSETRALGLHPATPPAGMRQTR
jgi:hypothetical protein